MAYGFDEDKNKVQVLEKSQAGELGSLSTSNKGSLVAAINELKAAVNQINTSILSINANIGTINANHNKLVKIVDDNLMNLNGNINTVRYEMEDRCKDLQSQIVYTQQMIQKYHK